MTTLATTVGQRTAPGPRGYPFVGALPHMLRAPLQFLLDATRMYGDVVRLGSMGSREVFLVSHPEHVKYVLQTNNRNFGRSANFKILGMLGSDNIAMTEGDVWRPRRRLLQPIFRTKQIQEFLPTMVDATQALLRRWRYVADTGQPIDITKEMMHLTLDIIVKTMFSVDIDSRDDALGRAVTDALEYVGDHLWSPFQLPPSVPTPANRRFNAARRTIDETLYRIIERRRSSSELGDDMLSRLLQARDEESGQALTDKQLHDELMLFFIAGHETTATALAWTWYLLSMHPGVERRVRAEVDTALGERPPTADDLASLQYTKQVIEESLRLYPPGWAMSRMPHEDDEVGGYTIPGQSIVMLSPYVTHHRADLWENPEGFDPERFAPGADEGRARFAWFPFGGGPYTCIAVGFAMMEAAAVVAMISQRYRLHLVPGQTVVPDPGFTLRAKGGIMMELRHRTPIV